MVYFIPPTPPLHRVFMELFSYHYYYKFFIVSPQSRQRNVKSICRKKKQDKGRKNFPVSVGTCIWVKGMDVAAFNSSSLKQTSLRVNMAIAEQMDFWFHVSNRYLTHTQTQTQIKQRGGGMDGLMSDFGKGHMFYALLSQIRERRGGIKVRGTWEEWKNNSPLFLSPGTNTQQKLQCPRK